MSVTVDSSSEGGTTARQTGRKSRDSAKTAGRQSAAASSRAGPAGKKSGAYSLSLLNETKASILITCFTSCPLTCRQTGQISTSLTVVE